MRHFDSLEAMKEATVEQLTAVPEITPACAEDIYAFFHRKSE